FLSMSIFRHRGTSQKQQEQKPPELKSESKVNQIKAIVGPLTRRNSLHSTDACLRRYLEAWNSQNLDNIRLLASPPAFHGVSYALGGGLVEQRASLLLKIRCPEFLDSLPDIFFVPRDPFREHLQFLDNGMFAKNQG
ncbi:hypothetical protein Tco_1290379, partial [Tanacetum coccineum]